MLPCLNTKTVKMLKGTADERYEFSRELFLQTHYPQVMNEFYKQKLLRQWGEEELFAELQDTPTSTGNRVYMIFGSTGSGKSELLCWLRDQWIAREIGRPVIRISRSELNPQLLIKKCYSALNFGVEDTALDEGKWDILLKKPIAIVNQVVWTALSEIMDVDEEIVPVAMLLRPVVESNILEFAKQARKRRVEKPLQILTEQEFITLQQGTTIPIHIKYKTLQGALAKKLEHFLFQGHSLSQLLSQLSNHLKKQNIRPLLLIDDLVQSVNLYAAEILDHFITLEEGNWDVIVGLTPGVVNETDYARELNQRVQNLDTIDDRVKKLWLSDEAGEMFFTLSQSQVQEYIEGYIRALKGANGYSCSKQCPHFQQCQQILGPESVSILPFNKHLIQRIYNGIPNGKGVLRYMVLHMREILRYLLASNTKDVLRIQNYIQRDVFIKHDLPFIKLLGEMFADPRQGHVTVSGALLKQFKLGIDDIVLPTTAFQEGFIEEDIGIPVKKSGVPTYFLDWIEGRPVNENVLEGLRKSTGQIVHEITKATNIATPYTPRHMRSASTIQRIEVQQRYKYPIVLEDQPGNNIRVQREVNNKYLLDFHERKPQQKMQIFANQAQDMFIAEWVYEAEMVRENWWKELERSLGLPLLQLAHGLYKCMEFWEEVERQEWAKGMKHGLSHDSKNIIEDLFLDWFSLRDNMIDYAKLDGLWDLSQFQLWLKSYKSKAILNKYSIGAYTLDEFLLFFQNAVIAMEGNLQEIVADKIIFYEEMLPFIQLVNKQQAKKMEFLLGRWPCGYEVQDTISVLRDIENWFREQEGKLFLENWQEQRQLLFNARHFIQYVKHTDEHTLFQDYEELQVFLRDKLKVRPRLERQLRQLLIRGETSLPRHQWKGLLRDLEEINPEIMKELVTVNLKINPKIVS